MAKFYRFLNYNEFLKLANGEEIKPFIDYSSAYLTTSKGVCFLGDKSFEVNDNKNSLQFLRDYMGNCVSDQILVEFENTDPERIHESVGKYEKGSMSEYWMESYDGTNMVPLRYKIATVDNIDEHNWIDYDNNQILQNPKSILEQIARQRREQKSPAISDIGDWCSEFSLLSEDNNGWYIEKDIENKTTSLSYGDICSKERKPIFSLSFKQGPSSKITRGLEEKGVANYSWELSGDIPEAWKDLPEKFSGLARKQSFSSLPYSHMASPDTICDFDYSLAVPYLRIAQLMKYAMLKATYPDVIDKYKLSFDGANPGRFFESIGLPVSSNPYMTPPLRLDTLKLMPGGFVLNNLYQNNPIFLSSNLKERNNREENSKDQIIPE